MNKFLKYNPKLTVLARNMRKNSTLAENKLWYQYLRYHSFKFTRQKPLKNYIVDFYCSKLKLVIEVDGETHIQEKDIINDEKRTRELIALGIMIIRFWNYEIFEGFDAVCDEIENVTKERNPLHPPYQGDLSR